MLINKMFKKIFYLISFILVNNSCSLSCYTQQDISDSNKLFTYQGDVYDITGYKHPGGKSDLLKTVGVTLEEWMDKPKYKFHYSKSSFYRDLDKMLVGTLSTTCEGQVTTSVTTSVTSSSVPSTSVSSSSIPSTSVPSTSVPITSVTSSSIPNKPTTTKEISTLKPIPNNTSKQIVNLSLFSFITFLFSYLQL